MSAKARFLKESSLHGEAADRNLCWFSFLIRTREFKHTQWLVDWRLVVCQNFNKWSKGVQTMKERKLIFWPGLGTRELGVWISDMLGVSDMHLKWKESSSTVVWFIYEGSVLSDHADGLWLIKNEKNMVNRHAQAWHQPPFMLRGCLFSLNGNWFTSSWWQTKNKNKEGGRRELSTF